jgi:K+ transporter
LHVLHRLPDAQFQLQNRNFNSHNPEVFPAFVQVTHGGYVPVAIAFIVVGISYVWHWGSTKRYMHSSKLGTQLEDILEPEEGSYTPFSPDDDVRLFVRARIPALSNCLQTDLKL